MYGTFNRVYRVDPSTSGFLELLDFNLGKMRSKYPTENGNVNAPATPTSIFSNTPLPPFSQAIIGGLSNSTINSQGFALPPLENALDFGNVDLDSLPPS